MQYNTQQKRMPLPELSLIHISLSAFQSDFQTNHACIRQADDLLSAVYAYAGRDTGGLGHLYSAWFADVSGLVGLRWGAREMCIRDSLWHRVMSTTWFETWCPWCVNSCSTAAQYVSKAWAHLRWSPKPEERESCWKVKSAVRRSFRCAVSLLPNIPDVYKRQSRTRGRECCFFISVIWFNCFLLISGQK